MKTISILVLLALMLSSCTVYRKKITETYVGYNNTANYFLVPNIPNNWGVIGILSPIYNVFYFTNIDIKDYNSNSFAYTICNSGGGLNCNSWFMRVAPGVGKEIPEIHFNNKN